MLAISCSGVLRKHKAGTDNAASEPCDVQPMDSSQYKFPTKFEPRKCVRHSAGFYPHQHHLGMSVVILCFYYVLAAPISYTAMKLISHVPCNVACSLATGINIYLYF